MPKHYSSSISGTVRLFSALFTAATVFLLCADVAAAQEQRHARLSSDLAERVRAGDQREANVIITALRNEAGELVGFAKVTRDLTERRAAQIQALADMRRVTRAGLARLGLDPA